MENSILMGISQIYLKMLLSIPVYMNFRSKAITIIALLVLAVTTLLPFLGKPKNFVRLLPGYYLCQVELGNRVSGAIIIRALEQGSPDFSVMDSNLFRDLEWSESATGGVSFSLINGSEKGFLVGSLTDERSAAGIVVSRQGSQLGRWRLRELSFQSLSSDADRALVSRVAGLSRLREEYLIRERAIEAESVRLSDEVVRLRALIREGRTLRDAAAIRLKRVEEERTKVHADVKDRRKRAAQLLERLEIAQRVTTQGSLVTLSRQALEREARWISSSMKGLEKVIDPILDKAWARSQEIRTLQKDIAREEFEIERLLNGGLD